MITIKRPKILYFYIVISLLVFFTGCAMLPVERMTTNYSEFNRVVEKSQNKMLLLNILRSSRRYPMYFTSFNALRGNIQYSFSGGVLIPFGSIGIGYNGAYQAAPSASYSTNPNFDIVVLDTQEFTRGIMTPVPMSTIDYYWKSGWPKDVLLHLLIGKMTLKNKNGKEEEFQNTPTNRDEFEKFQRALHEMTCDVVSDEQASMSIQTKKEIGPVDLLEAQKAGYEFVENKEGKEYRYQLKSKTTHYTLECKGAKPGIKLISTTTNKPENQKLGKIYIRSPEAIMSYLGEIVRTETEDGGYTPKVILCPGYSSNGVPLKSHQEIPLFKVKKTLEVDTDNDASVSVDFEGIKYLIPRDKNFADRCQADQTMHVLSLISLLIGAQKKMEQLPVTGVVNVIGR